MSLFRTLSLSAATLVFAACSSGQTETVPTETVVKTDPGLNVPFEKYTLDNGLDVILHVDKSDPVVAIDLAVHVGSARELPGRTGFAHLFEHLLFLDSENLGYGGLDEMNTRIGGEGTNGFTTNDMTQYFQAVPADALEKIIWAEADKLGWFIQTVSQDVVDNEKQVVKNEKRQRVDNQPYGHNFAIVAKTLYPEDHPYNWSVIGSLADLDAATLKDVQDFYKKWYVPNNVTVTISGDFEPAEAKTLVEKYFGEIPRGEDIPKSSARPATLDAVKSLYHEDNFATVPRLTRVWPTVEEYHPDSYALEVLVTYLSDGKSAPLNSVLIDEEKVTSSLAMFNYPKELSGETFLMVDANAESDIDGLVDPISKAFGRFEKDGISEADLNRIKTQLEVSFYGEFQSALDKAIQLGEANVFTGDPGNYKTELAHIKAVTPADVMDVYNRYIKNKPYVTTSFIPKGQIDLALEGAIKADIIDEKIVTGAEAEVDFDPTVRVIETPTPSSFDRTVEPEFGTAYTLPAPKIERATLDNGLDIYAAFSDELPLVNFSLRIEAGRNRSSVEKPAVAALTADLLEKGTANRSTAELENAIKSLGSTISVSSGDEAAFISGTSLARNFNATIALVEDMLTQPRWDAEEFELLKAKRIQEITQSEGEPNAIAARENAELKYPEGHIYHYTNYGPKDRLAAVTLEDLKAFYTEHYSIDGAKLRIVGDVSLTDISTAFDTIVTLAPRQDPLSLPPSRAVSASQVYFYDVPGAKQSVLRIERPSLSATNPDYPLATAINFPLGGIYTSKLNTELRVNKGYTYGIRSGFDGDAERGTFAVRSSVRSNVTLESLELIRDILANYGPDFTGEELETMKAALLRGQALEAETLSDKLRMLGDVSVYDYPADYKARNAERISQMTLADFQRLAERYIRPDAMNYLVVGDAETQSDRLKALGFGDPIMLETD